MSSRYEVEVTIISARDLKNVNWRHGDLKPYSVVWVEPAARCSTKADFDHDTSPSWDEKFTLPLPHNESLNDVVLSVDVVHVGSADGVKPLIGSARLHLHEIVDEAGLGSKCSRSLKLKRPSGRPQGRIEVKVKVSVKDHHHRHDPYAQSHAYGAPGTEYGYGSRDASPYAGSGGGVYGQSYGAGAPLTTGGYGYGAPPLLPTQEAGYGYGGPSQQQTEGKKKSKFGMGTGLAVGAAAGVLGGLALAGGAEYLQEHKVADEKVEEDTEYGDDF